MAAKTKRLTEAQVRALVKRIRAGDVAARNALVTANVGLVWWRVAKRWKGRADFDDLVSAGFIGLVRAADLYDPDKGAFSSYAIASIDNAIRRELERYKAISLPQQQRTLLNRAQYVHSHMRTVDGHAPSLADVAAKLGDVTADELAALWTFGTPPASVDKVLGTAGDGARLRCST
jgi:RNA polymerase sigma factor (sigma-70 family)